MRFWPSSANFGRFRPSSADFGRFRPISADFNRFRPISADFGRIWPISADLMRFAEKVVRPRFGPDAKVVRPRFGPWCVLMESGSATVRPWFRPSWKSGSATVRPWFRPGCTIFWPDFDQFCTNVKKCLQKLLSAAQIGHLLTFVDRRSAQRKSNTC